ncbi:MAG: endonuclease [Oscillospiraceae bacterium]|nr:endonuclease [Oscillospiraceae bacterium]
MKAFLKILLILVLAVVVLAGGLFTFLTVTEFKPADVETPEIVSSPDGPLLPGRELSVLSWNIGYAGLGKEQDFFMDGGSGVRPENRDVVDRYLDGISAAISELNPDLLLLQEVDADSRRTYGIDERKILSRSSSAFALNYSCPFVPIPLPPMGRVQSGLFTTTDFALDRAERQSLPCPFSWPLSTANLKRCLLVSYLPLEGSEKELVLVNLHLEAYDGGEGKIAQTRQLMDFLAAEYAKGNYVIAGGDFNQVFPGGTEDWPNTHQELWSPGLLEEASLPEGFRYVYDLSVPTCRLLNQPYDPSDADNTQYYVIDGFIVSPNVTVENVRSVDLGFENSDHNPVMLRFSLPSDLSS